MTMDTEIGEYAAKLAAQRARDEALAHQHEWTAGFQYAVVWRFQHTPTPAEQAAAKEKFPPGLLIPPPGYGWELNVDKGDCGLSAEPPSWAKDDSRVIMQAVYWRREAPGMQPSHLKAKLHEQRQ